MNDSKKTKTSTWVVLGVIIFLFILFIAAIANGNNNGATASDTASAQPSVCPSDLKAFESQAQAFDYKQLIKDPSSFNGQVGRMKGKILQIQEQGGQGAMLLSVTNLGYGVYTNNVYITYSGHTDAVEGDIVTVYGQMSGSYTYTSQANFQLTVPSMIGCAIIPVSSAPASVSNSVPAATQSVSSIPSAPVVPQIPKTWHTIATFSGSDQNKNTDPFTVQGSEWRVVWSATADTASNYCPQYGCMFYASVNDTSNGIGIGQAIQKDNITSSASDTSIFYSPGTYYLDVTGDSMSSWTLTIQDYF